MRIRANRTPATEETDMDTSKQPESKSQATQAPAKTPYAAPKLSIHGSIQQITQQILNTAGDGQQGSQQIP